MRQQPFYAEGLVRWPVLLLAFPAAVLGKLASRTALQLLGRLLHFTGHALSGFGLTGGSPRVIVQAVAVGREHRAVGERNVGAEEAHCKPRRQLHRPGAPQTAVGSGECD